MSGGGGITVGVPAGGFSPATLLARLLTVDGSGSGLDADKVRNTTPTTAGLAILALTSIATGGLIVGSGTNAVSALAIGANGKALMSNGTTAVWGDALPTTKTIASALEVVAVDASSPTELNALGSADAELVLVYQDTGGAGYDSATLYRLQDWSGAENLPYVVDSVTAGRSWVAISGRYHADKLTVDDLAVFDSSVEVGSTVSAAGTITSKPTGAAGIRLDPNSATGDFVLRLSPANLTANRRVTLPDADLTITGGGTLALGGFTLTVPATGTVGLIGTTNTWALAQTFTAAPVMSALTASRLVRTDASKNLESNAALTSTHVLYADANGWPTGSSRLTYNDSGGGGLTAAHASSSFYMVVSGAAGFAKGFVFNTGGVSRWIFQADSDAESGANAGSPFTLYARNDAGGAIDTPINIVRAAGGTMTLSRPIAFNGATLTLANGTNIVVNATTGTKIATATTQKLGFWNATPVVQPASASQAAVSTTAATNAVPYGYTTQAQADGIVTLLNEIRSALVTVGIIKGSA